jgi:hypothetical protein
MELGCLCHYDVEVGAAAVVGLRWEKEGERRGEAGRGG